MLEDRLKEEANRERALKDVSVAMAKDMGKVVENAEKRKREVEKA